MKATLYVILGSHACRSGMLMLEHKGIPYRRVDLPAGLHPFALRLLGFAGNRSRMRSLDGRPDRTLATADRMGTVPALRVGDQRVKTNRGIARFLDELSPEPPLLPAEPALRSAVEEAESWGDDVLQMAARRLVLAASLRGPDALINRADDGRLGPLLWRHARVRLIGARLVAHVFAADAEAERELLASVPGMLDRIDGWIAAGVLDGAELNAADFMIAPSLALLCYRADLLTEIERRAAMRLVDRVLPDPASV
jgi:glutathione S-transferase